jgi:iron(III) transport system permease protein
VVGVFLPLGVLLVGSFNTLFGFFSIADPWTTANWTQVFQNPSFLRATSNTLWLGLIAATIGSLVFALLAWVLVRSNVWGRWALGVMVWLPWAVPGLLLGFSLLTLLLMTPGLRGLFGTVVPLVAVMVIRELPIGVQMLRASVEQVSNDLEEAAAMSGAGFLKTFRRITLPLISPMLISVFVLVFMATVRDIGTLVLLSTPQNRTLSLLLFEYASSGEMESAAVIGVLIAAMSMVIVSLALRFGLKIR